MSPNSPETHERSLSVELSTRLPNKPKGLPIKHPFATASEDMCAATFAFVFVAKEMPLPHPIEPPSPPKIPFTFRWGCEQFFKQPLAASTLPQFAAKVSQSDRQDGCWRGRDFSEDQGEEGDRDINETAWVKFLVEILSTRTTFCVRNELLWLASKTKEKLHKKENRLNKYRERKTNKKLSFYLVFRGI